MQSQTVTKVGSVMQMDDEPLLVLHSDGNQCGQRKKAEFSHAFGKEKEKNA